MGKCRFLLLLCVGQQPTQWEIISLASRMGANELFRYIIRDGRRRRI